MGIVLQQSHSIDPVVKYLFEILAEKLEDKQRVLWLLAGGSAIEVSVKVSKLLQGRPLENLTVTLTDERYGDVGHADSNWHQLELAGLQLPGANLVPVIAGENLETTGQLFSSKLQTLLNNTDFRIGLFGIGPDGHTAGLLPGCSAIGSNELAASYEDNGSDVPESGVKRGLSRVTITEAAIAKLDEAVVYAVGEAKWPQLKRLTDTIDIASQPAQVLKRVPRLTIFTDMKEGKV